MVLLKKPLFANADKAITVIGAFLPSAAITISPQLVVKVKVLFLNGPLTSGGVIFFSCCHLALVFLHFTSADLCGAAFAETGGSANKITSVTKKVIGFVIFCI